MIETQYPTTDQLIQGQRTRRGLLTVAFMATVVLVFGTVGLLLLLKPQMHVASAFLVGLAIYICISVPVIIWQQPRYGIYFLVAGCILFGGDPSAAKITIPTTMVPFWWNISIIAQHQGSTALNGLAISPGELVFLLTALSWIVKSIADRSFTWRSGPITGWVLAYAVVLIICLTYGIARGGNMTIALWQLRAQGLFVGSFFLAGNIIRDREHVRPVIWIAAVCIGLQGLFGAITYFSMGQSVTYEGIMAHDDSMLFNVLLFILFLAWITQTNKKLTGWAFALTPCTVIAVMANQRRAGIGAFVVAFIALLPILWTVWGEKRARIAKFATIFFTIAAIYLPLTWNMTGPWALPARALRSNTDPTSRDAMSNVYRMAEDANLKFTRDLFPWTGLGFGKPFVRVVGLPEIQFPLRDYFPHNSLLWVWYSEGHFGFFIFLMLVASVIITGIHQLKKTQDPYVRMLGVLAVMDLLMVFIYGKFDLQLTNYREMTLAGLLVGMLSVLTLIDDSPPRQTVEAPQVQE